MGYEIHSQCNSAFVGAGRRAWSQVLFTRRQTKRSYRPLIGTIPWGEADLLLGWDREEVLRAIDPNGALRVGSPNRTYAVINTDALERQSSLRDVHGERVFLDSQMLTSTCKSESVVLRGFASLARYRFHNERLGDLVQLGLAFQLGMIPVTVDSINAAIATVDKDGFARSVEAFDFGRRVALDPDAVWQPVKEESQVDIERLVKRCVRDLHSHGRRGATRAEVVQGLIRRSRQALPGLSETVEGRQAMIDLVIGIQRCMLWGGKDVASRFVSLVCQLYNVDRPENGRALTRNAILPLAESILIRDPVYLARLARSPEVIRRIRQKLNVRHSRGDILERRFLSRFRLRLWKWSLQIDMRTSDWSLVVVSGLGKYIPKHWRGHRRDRSVREAIIHGVRQAATTMDQYNDWVRRFDELNQMACLGTLHTASVEDIKKILQS
jgi:indolepyruvate ferredoxin oxidoreductase